MGHIRLTSGQMFSVIFEVIVGYVETVRIGVLTGGGIVRGSTR